MKNDFPKVFFLFVVLLVTAAFLGLVKDYLLAMFWAIIFAILFHNRYELFLKKYKGKKNVAAGLTLLFILLLVIIPLGLVVIAVVNEAIDVYQKINASNFSLTDEIQSLQNKIPFTSEILQDYGLEKSKIAEGLANVLTSGTRFMAANALAVTQNIFGFLLSFTVMLYTLFFFLRDGKSLVQKLVWVLPIGDEQEWTLLMRFESVARATVKGSLLVAMVQGAIGGILFAFLGIPAAFLWGVLMVLASLLPVGGALVWAPWALALFLQGETTKAIILLVVGALFIGLIDNFLRPRLVGQDTKMPDYLILLSTLGGLSWFGLSGFVLGPIIAALFITSWEILGKEYGRPYEEVVSDMEDEEYLEELKDLDEEKKDEQE